MEAAGASDEDLADKARAEQKECQTFMAAALSTQGRTSEAVLTYSQFLTKYPRSPMASVALANGQASVANGAPEHVWNATR